MNGITIPLIVGSTVAVLSHGVFAQTLRFDQLYQLHTRTIIGSENPAAASVHI